MMWLCFLLFFLQDCLVMGISKISPTNQDSGFKVAKVGENLTLRCSCEDDVMTFFTWYQQKLGEKPVLISQWLKGSESPTTKEPFEQRFLLFQTPNKKETNNLKITNLQANDTATYFCGVEVYGEIAFGDGVFVRVQPSTSSVQSIIQERTGKKLWLGDSLELSCLVEVQSCSDEQRFYWLRHGTSQPAVIYPRDGDCDTSKNNCTVTLEIEAVEPKDAGTYYCVHSSCGELLFGNGTSVEVAAHSSISHPLVYSLSVVLGLFFLIIIMLIITVYKLRKKMSASRQDGVGQMCHCTQSEAVYYAALEINRKTELENQKESDNACTYSSVRSRNQ